MVEEDSEQDRFLGVKDNLRDDEMVMVVTGNENKKVGNQSNQENSYGCSSHDIPPENSYGRSDFHKARFHMLLEISMHPPSFEEE